MKIHRDETTINPVPRPGVIAGVPIAPIRISATIMSPAPQRTNVRRPRSSMRYREHPRATRPTRVMIKFARKASFNPAF